MVILTDSTVSRVSEFCHFILNSKCTLHDWFNMHRDLRIDWMRAPKNITFPEHTNHPSACRQQGISETDTPGTLSDTFRDFTAAGCLQCLQCVLCTLCTLVITNLSYFCYSNSYVPGMLTSM